MKSLIASFAILSAVVTAGTIHITVPEQTYAALDGSVTLAAVNLTMDSADGPHAFFQSISGTFASSGDFLLTATRDMTTEGAIMPWSVFLEASAGYWRAGNGATMQMSGQTTSAIAHAPIQIGFVPLSFVGGAGDSFSGALQGYVYVIPEPATVGLFGLGLLAIGWLHRARRSHE